MILAQLEELAGGLLSYIGQSASELINARSAESISRIRSVGPCTDIDSNEMEVHP